MLKSFNVQGITHTEKFMKLNYSDRGIKLTIQDYVTSFLNEEEKQLSPQKHFLKRCLQNFKMMKQNLIEKALKNNLNPSGGMVLFVNTKKNGIQLLMTHSQRIDRGRPRNHCILQNWCVS